jgi:hypothetical protein
MTTNEFIDWYREAWEAGAGFNHELMFELAALLEGIALACDVDAQDRFRQCYSVMRDAAKVIRKLNEDAAHSAKIQPKPQAK